MKEYLKENFIILYDDIIQNQTFVGTEFLNYPKLDYQEGDLVTFPAFLPHRSPINLTNKRKTSIVFNFTYE